MRCRQNRTVAIVSLISSASIPIFHHDFQACHPNSSIDRLLFELKDRFAGIRRGDFLDDAGMGIDIAHIPLEFNPVVIAVDDDDFT